MQRETDEEKAKKESEFKDALGRHDAKIRQIYNQIFEKDDKKNLTREKWTDDRKIFCSISFGLTFKSTIPEPSY